MDTGSRGSLELHSIRKLCFLCQKQWGTSKARFPRQGVENLVVAALLRQRHILEYQKIRVGHAFGWRLTTTAFEHPGFRHLPLPLQPKGPQVSHGVSWPPLCTEAGEITPLRHTLLSCICSRSVAVAPRPAGRGEYTAIGEVKWVGARYVAKTMQR